jgi:hypothetical protein
MVYSITKPYCINPYSLRFTIVIASRSLYIYISLFMLGIKASGYYMRQIAFV